LEKRGIGELLADLEALKARLAKEGLFDATHKKALPFLPRTVCVITSPTGAVIQDIIITATRRFPDIEIEILPVSVQGPQAATEIVDAIDLLNQRERADVAILARGGGAIEDFQAFNSESVARAIFASKIPIVSAVGHETDYTIADLVADLRAPTPTAAAELVIPLKDELMLSCLTLHQRLCQVFHRILEDRRRHLDGWSQRMVHPRKKIENWAMRVDELTERLIRVSKDGLQQRTHQLAWWTERLKANRTEEKLLKLKEKIKHLKYNLLINMNIMIDSDRHALRAHQAALQALNPRAILQRGSSITRTLPDHVIIRDSASVKDCQILEITLAKGSLQVKTLKKT
jgi:exodeoxyribonuclease VII large subunit